MRSARLLCVVTSLAQLGSLATITNRQEWKGSGKDPWVLMRYDDTEPAKNYCKGSGSLHTNSWYSNATIFVEDCVSLIRFLRGNSSRFELGNDLNKVWDSHPWLPAVGFGTCDFSMRPDSSGWSNASVGSLEIEHTIFKVILMNNGPYMHATDGMLRNCKGDYLDDQVQLDGIDMLFLIHNAQVDHKNDPAVNVTNGFATTTSHSLTTPTPTPTPTRR